MPKTKTPKTARQRRVVAKRKIGSQVSSASQGRTKSKKPTALDKNMQTLKSLGETLIKLAKTPGDIAAKTPGLAIKKGKMGPKNQPKPKTKESRSYKDRRNRASVKPASAKPTNYKNPPKKNPKKKKRKVSKYRG